jgi:hypothetical protein
VLPELPEGHGLAAKYPGDVGIEKDAAVVFAEGFEGLEDIIMEAGEYQQEGRKWDRAWGVIRVTRDPENVHSGRQAIEIRHTRPSNHGAEKHLESGHDTLFLRYYMKYAKEFPGIHHSGMAISGFPSGLPTGDYTGVHPNGRNHFTVVLDAARRDRSVGPTGCMDIYCYHMDQGRKWGDIFYPTGEVQPSENARLFAENFVPRPNVTAERGRWYCYELMVKANTPGERDGRVAFWVDGKLAGDFPNLRLRSAPILQANRINLVTHSSRFRPNATLWFDDMVAATAYIGPQAPVKME